MSTFIRFQKEGSDFDIHIAHYKVYFIQLEIAGQGSAFSLGVLSKYLSLSGNLIGQVILCVMSA